MVAPVAVGIFAAIALIIIMIVIFSGGDDSDSTQSATPETNICLQKADHSRADNLVENYLNELRLNDNFTDITIVSEDAELRAHKLMLASHSKYFDLMFWSKNQTDRFDIPNHVANYKSMFHALHFMYSGALPSELFDNETEYSDLLRAATEFQLDSLKCEISKRLSIRINANNVAHIVAVAEKTDAQFLSILASNYLLDHFDEVRKTNEWKSVAQNNTNILTNAIDFHGKLPGNYHCDIKCDILNEFSPTIFMNLRRFFITQRFADAEIHVRNGINEKVFYVNRAILIAQSLLFRKQFAASPKSIIINNTNNAVMEEFLNYMYSGLLVNLKRMAESLLYLSDEYAMKPLKNACEDIIIDEINIQNAGKIVEIANKANSSRMSSTVLDFILKNRKEIVATKSWTELKERNPQLLTKLFFSD